MRLAILIFLFWSGGAFAFQAGGDENNPFTVILEDGPVHVTPGQTYPFQLTFRMPEHYYLYQEKMEVEINPDLFLSPEKLKTPEAVMKEDPFFGRIVPVYYNEVTIELPLKISETGWEGEQMATGSVRFQGCSDKLCYKLMHIPFSIPFKSAPAGVISPPIDSVQGKNFVSRIKDLLAARSFDEIRKRGFGFALLLSFLAGFLTDFTPCVWPMIPVTLAVIGVRNNRTVLQNLKASFILVLGMAVMYSALGVTAASIGKGLGFLFQNIFFLIFLEIIFIAMAASLLGLFEIQLPHTWQTKLAKVSASGSHGIFLMGLTMGLIAAPCVGPVVGPLLAYVAKTQDLFAGFVLLLSYALGMGILFLVLGGAYGILKVKIRSGGWMLWLKRGMGVLLLLFAFSYGKVLYSQIPTGKGNTGFWEMSLSAGLQRSVSENKPVFIDFYAKWCPPCEELNRTVFKNPQVVEKLKTDWVAIKIDCTTETRECREAVEKYNVVGWPTLLFLDASQEERIVGEVISVDEMLEMLSP
ncbi:MAG: cytochrome c biogenesis protein CcdA [Deltaproteobacteria bacterium]|nr:cytochrome c biogenesis protein CcdA [Deltaproteobacteria bacterium]